MTKRTMPIKTVEFVLHGEGYEGWRGLIRTNAGAGKLLRLLSQFDEIKAKSGFDESKEVADSVADAAFLDILNVVYDILELVIHSWNFVDEKGGPIPVSREGFESLPIDLLFEMIGAVQQVAVGIPKVSSGS